MQMIQAPSLSPSVFGYLLFFFTFAWILVDSSGHDFKGGSRLSNTTGSNIEVKCTSPMKKLQVSRGTRYLEGKIKFPDHIVAFGTGPDILPNHAGMFGTYFGII